MSTPVTDAIPVPILDFHALRRTLTIGYLASVVALTVVLAIAHLHYGRKLANSYARASRYSLLSGDFAGAYNSLAPALSDGFRAIAIVDARGNHVIDLPQRSVVNTTSPTRVWFEVPVELNAAARGTQTVMTVRFAEDPGARVLLIPLAALLLLVLFRRAFNRGRARIERTQDFRVTLARARAERRLAERMAHDIRSPLSAITMTLARTRVLGLPERELLDRAAERIVEIAQDVLDHTRPVTAEINMHDLLAHVVEEVVAARADQGAVRVQIDAGKVTHRGDAAELARVLTNLVTNAFESGARVVTVTARGQDGRTRVTIGDNGRGMPAAVARQLGHERVTFGKRGNGLGVWEAADFARATGGGLNYVSEDGRGTTATLDLGPAPTNARDRAVNDPTFDDRTAHRRHAGMMSRFERAAGPAEVFARRPGLIS